MTESDEAMARMEAIANKVSGDFAIALLVEWEEPGPRIARFVQDHGVVRFYIGGTAVFSCSREQLDRGLAAMDDADLADAG